MSNDNLKGRVAKENDPTRGSKTVTEEVRLWLINDLYTALQEAGEEKGVINEQLVLAYNGTVAAEAALQLSHEQNKVAVEAIESLRFVGLNEKHWHKLAEALAKIEAMDKE